MSDLDPRWTTALRAHATAAEPTPEAWAAITERAADDAPADPSVPHRSGRRPGLVAAAALLVLLAAGAAALAVAGDDDPRPVPLVEEPTSTTTPAEPLVEGVARVLEDATHGPEICADGVDDLYRDMGPPSCRGVPVEGWSWDLVEGEDTDEGATAAQVHLTGRFVDDRFVLAAARDPEPGETGLGGDDPLSDPDRTTTPCPAPPGGWTVRDEARTTDEHFRSLLMTARAAPDLGEIWVDESVRVPGPQGGQGVMTASFTGDLERHRQELEAVYGGALCVTEAPIASRDLRAAADRLMTGPPVAPGGPTVVSEIAVHDLSSIADTIGGQLVVHVLHAPPGLEEALAAELGVPVVVTSTFMPIA